MFTVSRKTRYALVAMVDLAERYRRGLMQIREVAGKRNIPKTYLEQIFNRLGKHGIVKSTRGKQGGYELAVDPGELTVGQVIESLEGEIRMDGDDDPLVLKKLYSDIEDGIRTALQITISELAVRQRVLERQPMFHI